MNKVVHPQETRYNNINMNREVTPKQRKLIRIWLYAPAVAACLTLMIGLIVKPIAFNSFSIFCLFFIVVAVFIARKAETSRQMVLPRKEERNFAIAFAFFFISLRVGKDLLMHPSDWLLDLVGYSVAAFFIAPYALFFRKEEPEDSVPNSLLPDQKPDAIIPR